VVGGSGEADVGAAAVCKSAYLEGGDDGRTDCIAGGFDLSLVLAGGVVESVVADLGKRDLGGRSTGREK